MLRTHVQGVAKSKLPPPLTPGARHAESFQCDFPAPPPQPPPSSLSSVLSFLSSTPRVSLVTHWEDTALLPSLESASGRRTEQTLRKVGPEKSHSMSWKSLLEKSLPCGQEVPPHTFFCLRQKLYETLDFSTARGPKPVEAAEEILGGLHSLAELKPQIECPRA